MADADLKSRVRRPRGKVTANGKVLRISQFEVIQNGHQEADSFDVQLPLFDPEAPVDWKFWAEQTDIEIEILIGFADDEKDQVDEWTSLIVGPVDGISMAPMAYGPHSNLAMRARTEVGRGGALPNETGPAHPSGALLQIRGRDYSGQLIDSEVSSEVASGKVTSKQLYDAAVNGTGLSVDVEEDADSVGAPANETEGRLTLHRSAWDLISATAEHDGKRATMKGRKVKIAAPKTDAQPFTIFFYPAKVGTDETEFQPARSNVMTLRMARGLNVGRGVSQFVQSYDSKVGGRPSRALGRTRSNQRAQRSSQGKMGNDLTYTENQPGMTAGQARKHAHAKANQVSKFERDIEFQMPGEPSVNVDTPIKLTGTGTEFDQTYEINQLTHFFDLTQGYRMECRARNRSDDVEVTVKDFVKGEQPKAATQLSEVPHYSQ